MSTTNAKSIWRKMPMGSEMDAIEAESGAGHLQKSLGLWQLTAIGIGGIIGVGIFSLAGLVAHGDANNPGVGPAVLISFLIAGVASAAAALSYAEFAGMVPRAGSAYTYGYVAMGEAVAWFIGWDLLLEYVAIVAVVAIGISGYLNVILDSFGVGLPEALSAGPEEGGIMDLPAILFCLLVTFILSLGTKTFGRFELAAVIAKVLLILGIVGLGIFYIDTANYDPFMPAGFGPVFTGAATVFFAVFGYDAMSTAAEESKDGQKHMPRAIILSLVISMVLYVMACLVLTGMQDYTEIDPEAGFASAFESVGLSTITTIISGFAVVSILTAMLTMLLGVTRVWFAMSRDGLLPPWFAKTDSNGTPQRVTWICGIGAALLAGVFPIRQVADLTNIGILSAFVVVCIAVIVFRYTRPNEPRSFKLPFMPVVPAIGVISSAFLISQLHWETYLRFIVWLVIGFAIYFGYSRKHSLLNPDSPLHQHPPLPAQKAH